MTTARWQALASVVVATGFAWVGLRERRRGVSSWWGYLVGSTVVYALAVAAATGSALSGW
jgi:hypothetical protein